MILRREYIIGATKGVVVATGLAFSTHVVMETYMHDSQRVHHPLHAPGSIVVEVRSEGV